MRAKRRIFAGSVCEQEVYTVPERVKDAGKYEPRPRFSSKEEYEEFKGRSPAAILRGNSTRRFPRSRYISR